VGQAGSIVTLFDASTAFDLLPNTPHVETVVKFER
jgi:hypothetical protein